MQEAWLLTSWPLPSHPIQSYCLKVKEMDDEEYSCIVSTRRARGGVRMASGAHVSPTASEGLGLSQVVGMAGILGL